MNEHKRITVKLDPVTYKALKQLGLDIGKSNQDMLFTALREYMARWDAA